MLEMSYVPLLSHTQTLLDKVILHSAGSVAGVILGLQCYRSVYSSVCMSRPVFDRI